MRLGTDIRRPATFAVTISILSLTIGLANPKVAARTSPVGTSPTTTHIFLVAPNPAETNHPVRVAVAVSGETTPTGRVTISGADGNCSFTLTAGSGMCLVTFTTEGTKLITASYEGDATHAASSDAVTQTVVQASSITTFIEDLPDPSEAGEIVPVQVSVSGGAVAPSGTVEIMGADANCTAFLVSGSGSCEVLFVDPGDRTLTAFYSGDDGHESSSAVEAHVVV